MKRTERIRETRKMRFEETYEGWGRKSLTQFGRAMRQLGVEKIPAYSPEARGRSEEDVFNGNYILNF